MNRHFAIIDKYCHVVATVGDSAILYWESNPKSLIAEINGATFSCSSVEEFNDMVELFGEDSFME